MKRSREEETSADSNKKALPLNWNGAELSKLKVDHFHHLGLSSADDLRGRFGDVRLVLMQGSAGRADRMASEVAKLLGSKDKVEPIGKTDRGHLYKVGPVISMSHGMGMPSMLIFLHEVTKLLVYAGCDLSEVEFVRLGTSGGIGVEPGTQVICKECYNSRLEPGYKHVALGKVTTFPAVADQAFVERIRAAGAAAAKQEAIPVVVAITMTSDDFYEGQGRLDGALKSSYVEQDKLNFLRQAHDLGVRNMEMECLCFLAFFRRLGSVPATAVCTTLLDRLKGDQVLATADQLGAYCNQTQELMCRYIRQKFPNLCH